MSTKASQYQKKTPREHVLLRPDTYIGDIEKTTDNMYLCTGDLKETSIIKNKCTFVPGLLKIFDEILVNSRDAGSNDTTCNTIKVNTDNEKGCISIWNNGQDGIPVEEHPEHKILVPSMIFGELLTSSNYDDTEKRTTGGRNGYGAKLANIFSTEFVVEIGESKNKKKFIQHWYDNMSRTNKPSVTKYTAKNSYIKITFYPDFDKLHLKKEDIFNDNIEPTDHLNLFKRRCYDIAGTTSLGVNGKNASSTMKVYYNDNKLDVINFKKYIELYYKDETIYYDDSSNRWEVGVLYRPDNGFEVISFVNGIFTFNGGTHANHVVDQIIKSLVNDHILKKNKDIKINGALVKENLTFFINCIIENPAFSSQTKDTLTTKTNKFGTTYKANDTFLKKLAKCGIVDQVVKLAIFKETSGLKKTDGKKQVKLRGIPKLEDANKAGSKESTQCSLILTEGDSAKAFAMAGMGVVSKDYYGVFPLKGKLLNVREASTKVLSGNDEINFLKQIIGLKQNVDYSIEENFSQLRYGRVIILTDQDYDGSHIKGLVMNFFHVMWPELIERSNFITSLATPIVILFKGKQVETFYNITEYEEFVKDLKDKKEIHLWKTKYYKGLGTSTSAEAKEYFVDIEDKLIRYFFKSVLDNINPENSDLDAITLAFDKTRSDDRKNWLKQYDKDQILTYEEKDISYSDFIHKDLIHFSNDDTARSIPSVIDGFKPSQRKIFFGASLRGLDKVEVKVAQLAGFVSDKAAYHHGEMSLTGAIIGMAQDYVGANNINILKPNGQFGCVDPETMVLLWNSTIIKAKDVKVGDKLVGDDGLPRLVSKTITGQDTMYKIKNGNMNDYIVNSNHILTCQLAEHKIIYWKNSNKSWKMMYYDSKNNKFGEKSFTTNENPGNHLNKSLLSKEEAYNKMNEFSKTIQDNPIFDINVQDYIKLPNYIKKNIKGVLNSHVIEWSDQNIDKDLMNDIDPYILGSWLGDGMSDCHAFSSIDIEIIKAWALWLDKIGCDAVHCKNYNNHESCTYYIRRRGSNKNNNIYPIGDYRNSHKICKGCQTSNIKTGACDWSFNKNTEDFICNGVNIDNNIAVNLNPFKELMKKHNLYKNKHIPISYITSTEDTRLKLLAGMIDTDGSIKINKNSYGYRIYQCKDRRNMIESFRLIAGSLGYRAKVYEQKNNMLELLITGYNLDKIPVKIERKKIKNINYPSYKNILTHKIEIEKLNKSNFCGWHIDSNERFLLSDFTITHNTRVHNGKDSASPRYIWTEFGELTSCIIRKEDEPILKYQDEDGMKIEPNYYLPIIPTILINGAEGIGTGFSTKCPQFNPIDIINILVNKLDGEYKEEVIVPWYSLFEGTIEYTEEIKNDEKGRIIQPSSFNVKGNYHISNNHLIITELPIGESTYSYKEFLEKQLEMESNKKLKSNMNLLGYTDNNTDKKVYFDLEFTKGYLDNETDESILKNYHLIKKLNTTNIHLYNQNGTIKKYTNIYDIINEFYTYRLECYAERKKYIEDKLEAELVLLSYKVKFILSIINKEIKINNKSKKEIEDKLIKNKYPKMLNGIIDTSSAANYNYLLGMNLWSLSYEKVEELKTQENNKETELDILKKTKIETMWKNELEELLNKYEIWYENKLESVNDTSIKTKPTKTKAKSKSNKTIKKKKSIIV